MQRMVLLNYWSVIVSHPNSSPNVNAVNIFHIYDASLFFISDFINILSWLHQYELRCVYLAVSCYC